MEKLVKVPKEIDVEKIVWTKKEIQVCCARGVRAARTRVRVCARARARISID